MATSHCEVAIVVMVKEHEYNHDESELLIPLHTAGSAVFIASDGRLVAVGPLWEPPSISRQHRETIPGKVSVKGEGQANI